MCTEGCGYPKWIGDLPDGSLQSVDCLGVEGKTLAIGAGRNGAVTVPVQSRGPPFPAGPRAAQEPTAEKEKGKDSESRKAEKAKDKETDSPTSRNSPQGSGAEPGPKAVLKLVSSPPPPPLCAVPQHHAATRSFSIHILY